MNFTAKKFKRVLPLLLVVFFMTAGVAKAGFWDDYVQPAIDTYQNTIGALQYLDTDPKGQQIMYEKVSKDTGVSSNEKSITMLNQIMNKLLAAVKTKETITANYIYYVSPSDNINAFASLGHIICINDGTFTKSYYNEDEVAFIVAHEIAHVQGKHTLVNSAANIPLTQLEDAYKNKNISEMSYVISNVAMQNLLTYALNKPFEWSADNNGFDYMVSSGYNPGAPAAIMVRIKSIYGDNDRDFFEKVLSPEEHPTMTERINNFSAKLKEYSNNQIWVQGSSIYYNGINVYTAKGTPAMSGEEQAYLLAGKAVQYMKNNSLTNLNLGDLQKMFEQIKGNI